jgi:hypothetical protein
MWSDPGHPSLDAKHDGESIAFRHHTIDAFSDYHVPLLQTGSRCASQNHFASAAKTMAFDFSIIRAWTTAMKTWHHMTDLCKVSNDT